VTQTDDNFRFCSCCGLLEQTETITLKTSFEDVGHVGVSTFFYFMTLQHLLVLLIIMCVLFSGFALVTNVQAADMYRRWLNGAAVADEEATFEGVLAISLGSKNVYMTDFGNSSFQIQCWLGVALLAIWWVLFVVMEYRYLRVEITMNLESKTASQYTLVFKNMPKDMTKEELQAQLIDYRTSILPKGYNSEYIHREIKISKINEAIPFYLDESTFENKDLRTVNSEHEKCRKEFVAWIRERQK
jgi:hypothetical protein